MSTSTTSTTKRGHASIADLRVYAVARQLEDAGIALSTTLPESETYGLANDLRRSVTGIASSIYDAHRRYSIAVKLDALHLAIAESEQTKKLLADIAKAGFAKPKAIDELAEQATSVIKQCWGLVKYFKNRQLEVQTQSGVKATDELVAARA